MSSDNTLSSLSSSSSFDLENYGTEIEPLEMTIDAISWLIFTAFLIPLFLVYRHHKAQELFPLLRRYKTMGSSKRNSITKRIWLIILLNVVFLFDIFRVVIHEPLLLVCHIVVNNARQRDGSREAAIRLLHLRYLGVYIDFIWYFTMFCLMVPVWLKSALVWADRTQASFSSRLRKIIYVCLFSLIGIFVVGVAPLISIVTYELFRPSSATSIWWALTDALFNFTAPVVAFCIICILILLTTIGIKVIALLRNSQPSELADQRRKDKEKERELETTQETSSTEFSTSSSNEGKIENRPKERLEKHLRKQQRTSIKLSIAMILLTICAMFRLIGIALVATDIKHWIVLVMYLRIPAIMFLFVIAITFSPFINRCLNSFGKNDEEEEETRETNIQS